MREDESIEFVEFVESNDTATGKAGSSSIKPNGQADHRPEFCSYRDEGCELADSCLNCPFDRCIYDEPGGKQVWLRILRNREIARLRINEGKNEKELAEMFGISRRTVQRVLKSISGGSHASDTLTHPLPSRERREYGFFAPIKSGLRMTRENPS